MQGCREIEKHNNIREFPLCDPWINYEVKSLVNSQNMNANITKITFHKIIIIVCVWWVEYFQHWKYQYLLCTQNQRIIISTLLLQTYLLLIWLYAFKWEFNAFQHYSIILLDWQFVFDSLITYSFTPFKMDNLGQLILHCL